MADSFHTRSLLHVDDQAYHYHALPELARTFPGVERLPMSLKVLLENLLRHEDDNTVTAADIEALATWDPKAASEREIAYMPARVLMQDFTGVPAVCDLAAMRDAVVELGGDPARINPLQPAELVIDHSVQVDVFGRPDALARNAEIEFARNRERYAFLRWGQQAFSNFAVVPPDTGIVHQVNLEHLARVVFGAARGGELWAWPDTLVGTDSHTTMVNGLGVLGWGVGGIEAEAAMLGQPISMLIPKVVGMRLHGELPEGATATDLVLTVTERLRRHGVVGKFVEFFGDGLAHLSLADRATIANMAPEYGATCGLFPIDEETLAYLRLTGRSDEQVALVEAYARAQGLWRDDTTTAEQFSECLELDLGDVEPSLAGPRRPQDRIPLRAAAAEFCTHLNEIAPPPEGYDQQVAESMPASDPPAAAEAASGRGEPDPQAGHAHPAPERRRAHRPVTVRLDDGTEATLDHGAVVIAAITSCTNTSNPSVLLAAGLLAKKARSRGLGRKPWVKTSLAPGSMVVSDYLERAGLLEPLAELGFHVVGYGCTTCIGNSGPLPEPVAQAIREHDLVACAVLSGNRNFEGRVHPLSRMNFLASPPLVVAYALAGTMDIDFATEPLGTDASGAAVYLKDIWPSSAEVNAAARASIDAAMFRARYANVYDGDERWRALAVAGGDRYQWDPSSTYIKRPPFFDGIAEHVPAVPQVTGARVLALLGDSITTDHISPAGTITPDSPAGRYLIEHGVEPKDFNSYGSRRGNHEVMMRGTFANIRLRNRLAPGTEGGWTVHQPSGEQMTIFDAAMRYRAEGVPLMVIAGKEYGTGSSRDWAAKGTKLLGVRAVLAESFERIHRSNLVGMGVVPLTFQEGESADSLGLDGTELYDIEGLTDGAREVTVVARKGDGERRFQATVRIDTPMEWAYVKAGGILNHVLRELAA